MGFLGRVSKEGGDQPGTTVVAGGTKIVGGLQLSDDFHLDGFMEGRLRSSLNVSVGVNGQFDGEIEAKKVMISGRVCLLYTSPSPRDLSTSRMPSSA